MDGTTEHPHPLTAWRERQDPPKTQLDMAAEFDVDPATISRWERRLRTPERKHLPRLAELTGATFAELLGIDEPRVAG